MTHIANYVDLTRKHRFTYVKIACSLRKHGRRLNKFWRSCRRQVDKNQRRAFDGTLICFCGISRNKGIDEPSSRLLRYARMIFFNTVWQQPLDKKQLICINLVAGVGLIVSGQFAPSVLLPFCVASFESQVVFSVVGRGCMGVYSYLFPFVQPFFLLYLLIKSAAKFLPCFKKNS